MKRVILAGIGALAVLTTMGAANAADIQRRQAMPVKAPVYAVPYNWTGFYVGVNGGVGFGRSTWSGATGSSGFNTSGGLVGGTIGYNYQMGHTVVGLEGDLDWSNIRGSTTALPCTTSCETRNSWLGTARGRIGYAFDRFMPYVTGGLAVGDVTGYHVTKNTGTSSSTEVGWAAGAGVEYAFAADWSASLEYLYADLGSSDCKVGVCSYTGPTTVEFATSLVRVGVNRRW